MSWNKRTNATGMYYGEAGHAYYWGILDKLFTKFAGKFEYAMANCTIECYGRQLENGRPAPVTTLKNANLWHEYVNTNDGWEAIKYEDGMELKAGDIVEYSTCHVATVETDGSNPYISAAWWTDDNGKSNGNRTLGGVMGSTLQSLSNWMKNNVPYRFFHYVTLEEENKKGGSGKCPSYVLRYKEAELPVIKSVKRDTSVDQIRVATDEQNVRDDASINGDIIGRAEAGYFTVYGTCTGSDLLWYNIGDCKYIAHIKNRVEFLPKSTVDPEEKSEEYYKNRYENLLSDIKSIVNKYE